MKKYLYAIKLVLLVILASTVAFAIGPNEYSAISAETEGKYLEDQDVLFQVSTIDALLLSVYDGVLPVGELKDHGDMGIGTFDRLEGEMVMIDGECYQVRVDGRAYLVEDNVTTPFATVTFFEADEIVPIDEAVNYTQFGEIIEKHFPSENIFYAIKINGTFPYMKTRSVPAQEKPYPKLIDAVQNQTVFEFYNVSGDVVGFWSPEFVDGINVPGYHLHFISDDRTTGGHILNFEAESVKIELDLTSNIFMALPTEGDFYSVDLTQDLQSELETVEK